MLCFGTFGIQRQVADHQIGLPQLIHRHIQLTFDLLCGGDIPFDFRIRHRQIVLPFQAVNSQVGEDLWFFHITADIEFPFDRSRQPRNQAAERRCIDIRIQLPGICQLAPHIQFIVTQCQFQIRDCPLTACVTFHITARFQRIGFHFAVKGDIRDFKLPVTAVQAAPGTDFAVHFGRPLRIGFCGIQPGERQNRLPADGFLPVRHPGHFRKAL